MAKKIVCLLLAVMSCLVVSVSAFAAVPTDEASNTSTGSEFLDSVFSDWEEAGEQAKVLRDTYLQFLYNVCTNAGLEKILGDAKQIPIAWLRTTKAGVFAITPLDNIYYWLVNNNLVFDDRTSGESVKKTVDQTVNDPTVYVPTPWMELVKPASGGSTTGDLTLKGVIGDVTSAGSGLFKIGTKAFDFMLSTPLCFLALGCGFCFTALGLARRTLRASKRS